MTNQAQKTDLGNSDPIEDAREALADAIGAVLRAATTSTDPRGALIPLAEGWGPIKANTLVAAAKRGELAAYRLERGRLVAWERDVRAFVEREPVTVAVERDAGAANGTGDAQLAALTVACQGGGR